MEKERMDLRKIVKTIREQVIEEFRSLPGKSWVVNRHLLVVEKFANQLCDLYKKANREVVLLGVWLHDVGRARKSSIDHDLYGAEEARRILKKYNLPEKKIKLVAEVCRAHRCKDIKPKNLEAKILATADAMSHLVDAFYILLIFRRHWGDDFEKNRKRAFEKLERDFNDKILLPKVKKRARPLYDAWKKILSA